MTTLSDTGAATRPTATAARVHRPISDEQWKTLLQTRALHPEAVLDAYASRHRPRRLVSEHGTLFLVAADHPARGVLGTGGDALAMADRRGLLDRLITALAHPEVDGLLGSPDVVEELLLLGALENKVVIGSMNRGGLAGASWEIEDRFTGYNAAGIAAARLEGGKMLLRLDDNDPGTIPTLQACAEAVTDLARHRLMAMIEPLPYARDENGTLVLQRDAGSLARAVTVASGLGTTSAHTWLKLPACDDPEAVLGATTLPCVVLGGVPSADPAADLESWGRSLRVPTARGLVIGRALLFPPDGNVHTAVDAAAKLLRSVSNGVRSGSAV
jgi:uncharacterized protein